MLKNIVGGEIEEYTKLQAFREQAIERMVDDGKNLGADAIINIRFTTSVITQGASNFSIWHRCKNCINDVYLKYIFLDYSHSFVSVGFN